MNKNMNEKFEENDRYQNMNEKFEENDRYQECECKGCKMGERCWCGKRYCLGELHFLKK